MEKSISFIIPAYNEQDRLPNCLRSILSEAKNNPDVSMEIIVINNASSDATKAIALNFGSPVTVVDENQKGIVFARAAGGKAAKNYLLAHIDADCRLPIGWIKTVIEKFSNNPNLVALSGPHRYYDLGWWPKLVSRAYYWVAYLIGWCNDKIFHIGSLLQGGNFVVKKSAWDKMGVLGKDFSFYGEDTEVCRRLYAFGQVKFTFDLPILTSGRRLAQEGMISTALKYIANYFSVLWFKKPTKHGYKDIR